jgi:hypothetical protein
LNSPYYEIQVEGFLGDGWSEWFEGLTVDHATDAPGEYACTILSGTMDQAMLHGVLMRICGLGLPLISVLRTDEQQATLDEREVES